MSYVVCKVWVRLQCDYKYGSQISWVKKQQMIHLFMYSSIKVKYACDFACEFKAIFTFTKSIHAIFYNFSC